MLNDILLALWFFAPAGIANVTPIFAARIPHIRRFDAPIDFGLTFRGQRVFGAHKTWRGLVSGILTATLILWLQQMLAGHVFVVHQLVARIPDYRTVSPLLLGPLLGIGALGGDAIESFFKRQRGTPPGHGWFPFDQVDYILGAALLTMPAIRLPLSVYIWSITLWPAIHIVSAGVGYWLKIKERPI